MSTITDPDCIRCSFNIHSSNASEPASATKAEVVFAQTQNLRRWLSYFKNILSDDERKRAGRFYSDKDRETYICCHALLRLMLSGKLHRDPLNLTFINGTNNKPGLSGNQIHFNLAHTKDAFTIAIVRDRPVGIDLEKINQSINFHAIIKRYFSEEENKYILHTTSEQLNRFYELWTRKEALLKAIGTGIINNLNQVNVSQTVNYLRKESFHNLDCDSFLSDHYLYTIKLTDYYLSISVPHRYSVTLYNINEDNFQEFIDHTLASGLDVMHSQQEIYTTPGKH